MLDSILWILDIGTPWRDLPERFGSWSSVYTFRRWQSTGRLDAILEALQQHLNEEGLIDLDLSCIDGSNVRVSKNAAEARKNSLTNQLLDRSHGGFSCKIHLVTDGNGLPLEFCLSPEQLSRNQICDTCVGQARIPTSSGRYRTQPAHLAADKAYSSRVIPPLR